MQRLRENSRRSEDLDIIVKSMASNRREENFSF
jgi:hypothetical protein